MSRTTSRRPTTARSAASTIVSTPAARRRGPVQPKNAASGQALRNSETTREAYKSPDDSPAETRIFRAILPEFNVMPCYNRHGMSTDAGRTRLTVEELANRFRGEMIPLTSQYSYFSTLPMAEDDLRQYLNDPISAISPAITGVLPKMG